MLWPVSDTQPLVRPRSQGLRDVVKRAIPRRLLTRTLGAEVGRTVLLTFDDGPDPQLTPEVLGRLESFGIRAVFFVIGARVDAAPETLRDSLRRGHVVGNHTYSHHTPDPWFGSYLRDVRRCQAAVRTHAAVTPRLFRPPKGHLSSTSLAVPPLLGLRTVGWSLNVRDWACETPAEARRAAERLVREAAAGDIVLLHDNRPLLLPLLDFALPRLADAGFDLASAPLPR